MLKLVKISLSDNPNAAVSPDGNFNVSKDGRLYFMVTFSDQDNPFGPTRQRMISQQFKNDVAKWTVDLEAIKVGLIIPGDIVTMEVEPYSIGEGSDKREVTQYSAAVFKHETAETVFLNSGRKPVGSTKQLPPRFRTNGAPTTTATGIPVLQEEHVAEVEINTDRIQS